LPSWSALRCASLVIAKTDFGEIVTILQQEVEFALTELTAIDSSMFTAQNNQYLAALFPNGARSNGNGEAEENSD
jgi:hypothetical protein